MRVVVIILMWYVWHWIVNDSVHRALRFIPDRMKDIFVIKMFLICDRNSLQSLTCLLYTSDAADEL